MTGLHLSVTQENYFILYCMSAVMFTFYASDVFQRCQGKQQHLFCLPQFVYKFIASHVTSIFPMKTISFDMCLIALSRQSEFDIITFSRPAWYIPDACMRQTNSDGGFVFKF